MGGDFEQAGSSGASLTIPTHCSALRKGGYVCVKGHPCQVVDMSTSKTGKHGSAKVNFTAIDIFTNKKYEDMSPATANVDVPVVTRSECELVDITDDGFLSLMTDEGEIRAEIRKKFLRAPRSRSTS